MKIRQALQEELCRREYLEYVKYVHGNRYKEGKLHVYLCNEIQKFIEKKGAASYEILCLSVPPQHGKSLTITETLPSWFLGKYPNKRVIEVSYNEGFAIKFGRKNKAKIEEFGRIFNVSLGGAKSAAEFELSNGVGSMISRGVLSGITGNSGDLIIIDDPIRNRQDADSKSYRDKLWDEFNDSIKTRTQAGTKIIVIQTRWHEDDLIGRILKHEKNVTYINIPCEAEENDPLGREVGEALAPEIGKGNEWLQEFKANYADGMRSWYALYQGHPSIQEGNMFKRDMFKFYEVLPSLDYTVLSVDATFKEADTSDYVAIQLWGKKGQDAYLIKRYKKQMGIIDTIKAIENMLSQRNVDYIFIEDKANGSAIIEVLKRRYANVIPVNPDGGKVARANAILPFIEAGHVYLPMYEDLEEFMDECAEFPNGAHDDEVDSMTQALNRMFRYIKHITEQEIDDDYLEFMNYGR